MAILTKAQQVDRYIRSAITTGKWAPGEMLPPERELVEILGVSRGTLRNAVYALAKEGLVVKKLGSGTYVAESGSKMGTIEIFIDASLMRNFADYAHQGMVKEAQRLIADSGYRAALALGQGDTPEEVVASTHLLDPVVMADMLGLLSVVDPSAIRKPLADAGIPSVEIAYGMANHAYSTVLDYGKMEQMAVKALRAHGHTEFAVVIYDYEETRGVFKAHRTVGEDQVISVPAKHVSPYAAYEAFKKWWASPGRPRAIFFEDDWLFECASRAILELGIKIPNDLAVITHSNVGRVFQFPVPVTCIEFDLAEVVSVAWSMLRTLVAGEEPESPVVYISPKLHEGSSL